MLEYVKFNFSIRLTEPAHIGDGEMHPLETLCTKYENRKRQLQAFKARLRKEPGADEFQVRTVVRDHEGIPLLDPTAFRGAMRASLASAGEEGLADDLLGPQFGKQATPTAGRLWLFGGSASNVYSAGEGKEPSGMPFWDRSEQSFILAGLQLNPHLKTVSGGHLYNTEYLAAGVTYTFEAFFHGTLAEFEDIVFPSFEAISSQGLILGGDKGYGYGQAVLVEEALSVIHCFYSLEKQDYEESEEPDFYFDTKTPRREKVKLIFSSSSPYLSLDPTVKIGEEKQPDWTALKYNLQDNAPHVTGKSVLQALRALAERIELEDLLEQEAYDYARVQIDSNAIVRCKDDVLQLSSSQRLFGAPGWAKVLRVLRVNLPEVSLKPYEGQMIKLDVFTQAPIDSALVEVKAPVPFSLHLELAFEGQRYAPMPNDELYSKEIEIRKDADRGLLKRLIEFSATKGIRIGHATSSGFGNFVLRKVI